MTRNYQKGFSRKPTNTDNSYHVSFRPLRKTLNQIQRRRLNKLTKEVN